MLAPSSDISVVLSRRQFLAGTAALLVLAGCESGGDEVGQVIVPDSGGVPIPMDSELGKFLTLSGLLADVPRESLDPDAAGILLEAYAGPSLDGLFSKAGFAAGRSPRSLRELESRGVFSDPSTQTTADAILGSWYTGKGPDENQGVLVFSSSLQWPALGYNSTPSVCHFAWWDVPSV